MLKVMSLLRRREDLSLEAFRHWALEEHPKLALQLPGLRGYRMNVVLTDDGSLPFHAVSEMWFDDDAARQAAFATPEGTAAASDAMAHCAARQHLLTEERVLR